jgi:hypothetical protein
MDILFSFKRGRVVDILWYQWNIPRKEGLLRKKRESCEQNLSGRAYTLTMPRLLRPVDILGDPSH